MNTYTHGCSVTCIIDGTKIDDAKISIDSDGTTFICQNVKHYCDAEDYLGYEYSYMINRDFTCPSVTDLKLATNDILTPEYVRQLLKPKKDINDISTYEVGDVLVNWQGESMILSISGRIIIKSVFDSFDTAYDGNYTVKDLIAHGYEFKDTQHEKETIEVTKEEIAEWKGVDIKQIKIID